MRAWKMSTRITSGIDTKTDAAMISPNGSCRAIRPESCAMATGTVCAALSKAVKVSANRYSFHAPIKASKPVVTSAGAVSGRRICQKVCIIVAPSTCAACRSVVGRVRKNEVSTHAVKGSEKSR